MNSIYKSIWEQCTIIRAQEQFLSDIYAEGHIRCPMHLSIGQELLPVILGHVLEKFSCFSTHRSHAHYLAKGGSLEKFVHELLGLPSGCSGGYGGSMHLIDQTVGFQGSTAIVGNTIPIGVGYSLASALNASSDPCVIYIGDAATEEGVFYESANIASLFNTPTIFACENNQYSVYTPYIQRRKKDITLSNIARSLGLGQYP